MCYKKLLRFGFTGLALTLILAACVKTINTTHVYNLNGTVTNIANVPLENIRVIMHRSYSVMVQSDTTYTDAAGKCANQLVTDNKQRAMMVTFTDLSGYYRDTLVTYSFSDKDTNVVHNPSDNSYTVAYKLKLQKNKRK